MSWVFIDAARLFEIAGLNILLSGDNVIVVGMAIRNLPLARRRISSAAGISGAVLVQTAATLMVASLLEVPAVSLAGGILLILIAIRLARKDGPRWQPAADDQAGSLLGSIMTVIVAYLLMSLDNILAIAAVGGEHPALLAPGLALSGAFLIPASLMIANLMRRYPVTLSIGAAVVGWTAGSMIAAWLPPLGEILQGRILQLFIPAVTTVMVVTSPWWWKRDRGAQPARPAVKE
ncbi:MAG TPA: YjbE family putative metal transport protein [Candidatus Binataceae bacterium]|nr:YjbE family putative metal transport protein [Candidatus Binataceae bacterium]